MNTTAMRSRWAAVGAAVAITLGAGGIGLVSATSPAGAVAFVPLDSPCRGADTRPGDDNVGDKASPIGPGETHTINSNDGDCDGLVPGSATGLQLNVTALNSTIPSFLTIWASGDRPNASSLNPTPGQPPVPNAVTTAITGAGDFNIFNNSGNVDVVVDVVGYYTDHNHDDRYYQKSETYTKGEVDAAVGAKANSADVYTKTEVDDKTWSSSSLTNEAGVSVSTKMSTTGPFGATDVVVHTVRIRPPSSGSVTVRASLDWFSPTAGSQTRCQITDGTNTIDGAQPVVRDTSANTNDLAQSMSVEATFSVDAYTGLIFSGQPFNLVCDSASGNSRIADVTMTATFLPTSYAPFNIVLPLGNAARLDAGGAG